MRRAIVVLCASVAFAGCGSSSDTSSPSAACNSISSASCNKAYSCNSSLPGNATTCTTAAEAEAGCATLTCPTGKVFSSSQASQCLSDINSESCADVNNEVVPVSCDNICQ
jgi:hypothetical protein